MWIKTRPLRGDPDTTDKRWSLLNSDFVEKFVISVSNSEWPWVEAYGKNSVDRVYWPDEDADKATRIAQCEKALAYIVYCLQAQRAGSYDGFICDMNGSLEVPPEAREALARVVAQPL